jgi:hypothetical protein
MYINIPSRNSDDALGHRAVVRVNTSVADEVIRGDVHDRTVIVGNTDASELASRDAVDVHLLEDRVRRDRSREGESGSSGGELHCGKLRGVSKGR